MKKLDMNECKSKIIKFFEDGVSVGQEGDSPILRYANGRDCFISAIPFEEYVKFKKNFQLADGEVILLARDTSLWNLRTEGVVITDRRVVYKPDEGQQDEESYSLFYASLVKVTYEKNFLLFWGTDTSFFSIPCKCFLKSRLKSYDMDQAVKKLGELLDSFVIEMKKEKINE